MNRLSTLVTLIVLSGLAWACAFGVIGLSVFAGIRDSLPIAGVFGVFGFTAGAGCTVLRLVFEHQLPMDLVAGLRHAAEPAAEPVASAFGA
jgi:hypothetical protein